MKVDKLRGIIVSEGMTQEQVARQIGMSPKTFYNKMKRGYLGRMKFLRWSSCLTSMILLIFF